jgi:conjugal transfer pilus assembly protein TraV
MRLTIPFLAIGLLTSLSGCATFGTNVEGDFACLAPKGDCAPSHVIDAEATASLSGDLPDRGVRLRVGVANDDTTRTDERTLRIVFPAHVDETGTLHDEAVAWAVVANPRWAAELRRRPGDDAAPPMMRQLKRQLRAAQRQANEQPDVVPISAPADDASPADDGGSLFSAAPSLPPSPNASPLVLPSTAREAVAGAKAPAVEGFDVPQPPHDRTPRPHGDSPEPIFPTGEAIDAAKAKRPTERDPNKSVQEQK